MKTRNTASISLAAFALIAAGLFTPASALEKAAAIAPAPDSGSAMGSKHAGKNSLEQRITHLHDQLKITSDEETLWTGVAQAMTDNSNAIDSAIGDRMQKAGKMNAIDDMNSYQAIAASHADGLKNLSAMFAKLYAVMPEAQQKNADAVFGRRTVSKLKAEQHS